MVIVTLCDRLKSKRADEATVWAIPVAPAEGLFFRCSAANAYQKERLGASFVLSLRKGLKESNTPPLTSAAFPAPFVWGDGNYVVDGLRIPSFKDWREQSDDVATTVTSPADIWDDYTPSMRTYDDISPTKKRRAEEVSDLKRQRITASANLLNDDSV